MTEANRPPHDAQFHISRNVAAPIAMVWKAYTEQEPLMQWFGPSGFSLPYNHFDLRVGGHFHYCLRTPTGLDMWGKWTFMDIAAPHKLSMVITFSDAQGGVTRHPLSPNWPLQTLSTTTFAEAGDKTLVSIDWEPYQATHDEIAAFRAGHAAMAQGCNASFDQLDTYLAQLPRS